MHENNVSGTFTQSRETWQAYVQYIGKYWDGEGEGGGGGLRGIIFF